MSAQVLSFFWELAALNVDRRVKAAASLITALRTAQAEYEAGSGGALSPDLVYAVRRLVRGLASPRDGARQGFGAALIEVLGAFDEVTPEEVLEQMESTLQLSGAIKGSEERDVLFGRLFACGALVRSGRVPRLPPKRRGAVASKLSSQLLSCAGAKAFLQEPAACIACEFLASLPATDVVASVWPKLAPLLKPPMAEWQPHALLLALCLARTLPPETFSELVPHCEIRDGSIVHSSSLPKLLPSLKASSMAHPRLHAVWGALLDTLCPYDSATSATASTPAAATEAPDINGTTGVNDVTPTNGKTTSKQRKAKRKAAADAAAAVAGGVAGDAAGSAGGDGLHTAPPQPSRVSPLFRRFWCEVVDEGLVPSTLERKFMAFSLLQATLPRLGGADLPLVLSPGLLRCLVNALEGTDRMLRPVAAASVSRLVERARAAPQLRVALVSQLLARASRGPGQDRADASRALRQLVSQGLDPSGEEEYTTFLLDYFATGAAPAPAEADSQATGSFALEQERAQALEANRRWAVEQIYSLAKSSLAPPRGAPDAKGDAKVSPPHGASKKKRRKGPSSGTDPVPGMNGDVEEEEPHAPPPRAPPAPPVRTLRFLFHSAFASSEPGSSMTAAWLEAIGGLPHPPPSDAVRSLCASRFFSLLGETLGAISGATHADGGAAGGTAGEISLLEACQPWWAELTHLGVVVQPASSSAKAPAGNPADEASSRARTEALSLIAQLRARRIATAGGTASVGHRQLAALELLAHHLALQLLSQPAAAAAAIAELPACVLELRQRLGELPGHPAARGGEARRAKQATPTPPNGLLNGSKKNAPAASADGSESGDSEEEPPAVVEVVVDVLLAMLVQPSAMLREMARSVIRPFGDELTEGTVELLLNVLRAPIGGGDEDEEGEGEEEGGEEEEEDGEDGDSQGFGRVPSDPAGEAESASEESGEDEAAEQMVRALEAAAGLRAAPAAADGDDDSDVEMPDNPEDMARLDAQLGAMVRERVEAQAAARERREQQLHFKMRTLELVETLARRPAPSAVLLLLPLPLLRMLSEAAAQPAFRPLFERVSGLLRHRLCKIAIRPPWPDEALSAARLFTELEGTFALAAKVRGGGAALALATTDVVMLLMRTMAQHRLVDAESLWHTVAGGSGSTGTPPAGAAGAGCLNAPVLELLSQHLSAFYGTKNCRLNGRLVNALLERFPVLGWCVAPLLVQSVAGARDAFLCGEACSHLCTLLGQRPALGEACARLLPHVPALGSALCTILSRGGLRSKHLLPPVRLATVLVRTLKDEQPAMAHAACAQVAAAIVAVRETHGHAKALAGGCAKFCALASSLESSPPKKAAKHNGGAAATTEAKSKRADGLMSSHLSGKRSKTK